MDEKRIEEIINDYLDRALGSIYDELEVKSGDIDPFMLLKWEDNVSNIAKLFKELIEFNS